jgi:hypothetical protein
VFAHQSTKKFPYMLIHGAESVVEASKWAAAVVWTGMYISSTCAALSIVMK